VSRVNVVLFSSFERPWLYEIFSTESKFYADAGVVESPRLRHVLWLVTPNESLFQASPKGTLKAIRDNVEHGRIALSRAHIRNGRERFAHHACFFGILSRASAAILRCNCLWHVLISHTRARLCCCYAAIVSDMWPYLSHTCAEHALMSRARAAILHRNWGTVPPHIGSDTSHSHPRVSRVRARPGRPSPRALTHPRAR
jgi:hypothetical protein